VGQTPTRIDRNGRPRSDATPVKFVYTGRTTLTVVGAATRMLYRFDGTGAVLGVDRRDAAGLAAVPALERVGSESPDVR
jgi:hypothetical protein